MKDQTSSAEKSDPDAWDPAQQRRGILREFGVDPDTKGIDIVVSDKVPQDFLSNPDGPFNSATPVNNQGCGFSSLPGRNPFRGECLPQGLPQPWQLEAPPDLHPSNGRPWAIHDRPQAERSVQNLTDNFSRNFSIEIPTHLSQRMDVFPSKKESTRSPFPRSLSREVSGPGVPFKNRTGRSRNKQHSSPFKSLSFQEEQVSDRTLPAPTELNIHSLPAHFGGALLARGPELGIERASLPQSYPPKEPVQIFSGKIRINENLERFAICRKAHELIDPPLGTQTDLGDIQGEVVGKGKRGPKPRNLSPPRSTDIFNKLFRERKHFRAFIDERDCRLISFFCCFRSVFPDRNQARFARAVSRLLRCKWSKKILAYLSLLQPRAVRKNEQYQKKIFKLVYKNLNSSQKTKVLSLSESKPRLRESEEPEGEQGEGGPRRRNKIEKRSKRRAVEYGVDVDVSFNPFPEASSGSESEDIKDVAYNSRTFEAVGRDPVLGRLFNSTLASLRKDILPQLFGDLITEISSAVKFYQKTSGESPVSRLPNDGTVSSYLDLYYVQWDYLVQEGGLAEKSRTKKKRTLKLPWTFRVFYDAIENLEKAMGIERSMEATDPLVYFMGPTEALTLAENSRLLSKELSGQVWNEIKEMVQEADILEMRSDASVCQ